MSKTFNILPVVSAAMCLMTFPAMAQLPADAEQAATGTASPERVQQQFQDRTGAPDLMPGIDVQNLLPQNIPDGAGDIRFELQQINFEGLRVYTPAQLRPVYARQLGTTISLADLYGIAARLTRKYRNEGYILTQVVVPPQTIEGGQARLQIVEGFIDRVQVSSRGNVEGLDLVRRYTTPLQDAETLNASELERVLLLINDLPGIEARAVISPSQTTTGAADLRIIVRRDAYDALLSADNFGSRYLGPLQLTAAGSLNSYFGYNELITGQFVYAPNGDAQPELAYGAVNYEQPINRFGTKAGFFFSRTITEPGYDLDQFDVEGRSNLFSATLSHPFIRRRSQNLTVRAVFDWRDVETRNNLDDPREDRIRSARAGARYEFLDTLLGTSLNVFDFEFSQGLGILGASEESSALLTRANGDPQYTKITADIQRLQRVTDNVDLLIAASGQLASNALLSSEEFGVGGINVGRGFDPSEIIGDDGVSGKVELQWDNPVRWDWVQTYEVYGFFDAGRIWNKDATSSATKRDTITSSGFGVRANFQENTEAGLAVAFPLNRDVDTQNDQDPRLYLNLSRSF